MPDKRTIERARRGGLPGRYPGAAPGVPAPLPRRRERAEARAAQRGLPPGALPAGPQRRAPPRYLTSLLSGRRGGSLGWRGATLPFLASNSFA